MATFSIVENRDTIRSRPWELRLNAYRLNRAKVFNVKPGGRLLPGAGPISALNLGGTVLQSTLFEFREVNLNFTTEDGPIRDTLPRFELGLSVEGLAAIQELIDASIAAALAKSKIGGVLQGDFVFGPGPSTITIPILTTAGLQGQGFNQGFITASDGIGQYFIVPTDGVYTINFRLGLGEVLLTDPALPDPNYAKVTLSVLRDRGGLLTTVLSEINSGAQQVELALESSLEVEAGDKLYFQFTLGADIQQLILTGLNADGAGTTSVFITEN